MRRLFPAVIVVLTGLCIAPVMGDEPQPEVTIKLTDGSNCVIGITKMPCADVVNHLREVLKLPAGSPVRLLPDKTSTYETTVKVIELLRKSEYATPMGYVNVADSKPFVAWLIEPQRSGSASIEVWDTPSGRRTWRLVGPGGVVLAEMNQPEVKPGYEFNWGGCRIGSESKDGVIALVRHSENQEWSADIAAVWLADAKNRRFVAIDPKGMTCRNEGYGV